MGTYAYLSVNGIELDWAKNEFQNIHSYLYPPEKRRLVSLGNGTKGCRCKLGEMIDRLELLGCTLETAKDAYESMKENYDYEYYAKLENVGFDEYHRVMSNADLSKVSISLGSDEASDLDFGEYPGNYFFQDPEFNKEFPIGTYTNKWEGEFFANLDSHSNLKLLSENKKNLLLNVDWQIGEVIENGYCEESELLLDLDQGRKFLIATEGTSDANILKKAISVIRPDLADFFYFVDTESSHPFVGSGSLVNFAKGLKNIGILNNVLVVFDNDTEGVYALRKLNDEGLPLNIRAFTLPDLDIFKKIKTIGPQGESEEDINGRACAIECYLDLKSISKDPIVRWSSYINGVKQYQGALEGKDEYCREFLGIEDFENYNLGSIEKVIDKILAEAKALVGGER